MPPSEWYLDTIFSYRSYLAGNMRKVFIVSYSRNRGFVKFVPPEAMFSPMNTGI